MSAADTTGGKNLSITSYLADGHAAYIRVTSKEEHTQWREELESIKATRVKLGFNAAHSKRVCLENYELYKDSSQGDTRG